MKERLERHKRADSNKMVPQNCKRINTSLAMAWINYRKANDMVLHFCVPEALKMTGVVTDVQRLLKESMTTVRTENAHVLGEIRIQRGIFQFVPFMIFVIRLIC